MIAGNKVEEEGRKRALAGRSAGQSTDRTNSGDELFHANRRAHPGVDAALEFVESRGEIELLRGARSQGYDARLVQAPRRRVEAVMLNPQGKRVSNPGGA